MSLVPAAIKGLAAKGTAKLVSAVSPVFGYITKPGYEDRMNQVKARKAVHTLKAKFEIEELEAEQEIVRAEREVRKKARLLSLEDRRQEVLEDITAKAAVLTEAAAEEPSEQPVDEDWMFKFMESCQDVKDEDMQSLWAQILAGEVIKPGRYSPRTLNCVRTMSKAEADKFTRLCSCLWTLKHGSQEEQYPLLFEPNQFKEVPEVTLAFEDLMHLEAMGLIYFNQLSYVVNFTFSNELASMVVPADYFGDSVVLTRTFASPVMEFVLELGQVKLTEIGKQLAPISGAKPYHHVREIALKTLKDKGWEPVPDVSFTTTFTT